MIKKILLSISALFLLLFLFAFYIFYSSFYGASLIHYAAASNNVTLAKICLFIGSDINSKKPQFKDSVSMTPLEWASDSGANDVAEYLFKNGAEIIGGRNALGLAAKNGNIELVKFFLQNGVDPDVTDSNEMTALQYLIIGNGFSYQDLNTTILSILIKAGANVNAPQDINKTKIWPPLYNAAYYAKPPYFKILLENGANYNAEIDGIGSTKDYVYKTAGEWPNDKRKEILDILQEYEKSSENK